jgi:hypothetical protein
MRTLLILLLSIPFTTQKPRALVAKARTLAKAREAAQLTEANHLKHSDETAVV